MEVKVCFYKWLVAWVAKGDCMLRPALAAFGHQDYESGTIKSS